MERRNKKIGEIIILIASKQPEKDKNRGFQEDKILLTLVVNSLSLKVSEIEFVTQISKYLILTEEDH